MYYFINYKGIKLGSPMSEAEAKAMMKQLECCFKGLTIESVLTLREGGWPTHTSEINALSETSLLASSEVPPHKMSHKLLLVK